METTAVLEKAKRESWTDLDVVERVKAGDTALYEIIMRRYNQRLYRVALAILRNDLEAEDVIQDAYVRAYEHLGQYHGPAPFSAWLTRITVNEALHRLRLRRQSQPAAYTEEEGDPLMDVPEPSPDPEQRASISELGHILERAVLDLPDSYRTVLMLRDIEQLSTAETAAALDLSEENVKVRLHRGRLMARDWLVEQVGANAKSVFPFMGVRCDRVVHMVFERLGKAETGPKN